MGIDVLAVLDEMDAFRRKHENDSPVTADWCMRCMEAILANAAGYKGRTSWTDKLLENSNTEYSKAISERGYLFRG